MSSLFDVCKSTGNAPNYADGNMGDRVGFMGKTGKIIGITDDGSGFIVALDKEYCGYLPCGLFISCIVIHRSNL